MKAVVLLVVVAAACSDGLGDEPVVGPAEEPDTTQVATPTAPPGDGCAHVIDATALQSGDETWTFSATVRSADTGEEKYADAWEVRTADGDVLGTRVLAHPHVTEQPFTRNLTGVVVPDGITEVVVAASDSVLGFCGEELRLELS